MHVSGANSTYTFCLPCSSHISCSTSIKRPYPMLQSWDCRLMLTLLGNQYRWLGTIFYFGYVAAEPIGNRCLQYFPRGKFTAGNMVI